MVLLNLQDLNMKRLRYLPLAYRGKKNSRNFVSARQFLLSIKAFWQSSSQAYLTQADKLGINLW